MGYKKGVVEGINLKPEREGQYGKFAGYGMKIGDEWFNGIANTVKSLGRVAVVDKNYNEITKGMEVEFMFDTNDKGFHDIDKKTLLIVASGSATPQPTTPQPTEQPQKPVEQRSAPQVDNDAIIRSNCLVAAAIKAHGSLSQEDYKKLEMDMLYRAADTYMDYCKNGRK